MKSPIAGIGIDMAAHAASPKKFGWIAVTFAVLWPVAPANAPARIAP